MKINIKRRIISQLFIFLIGVSVMVFGAKPAFSLTIDTLGITREIPNPPAPPSPPVKPEPSSPPSPPPIPTQTPRLTPSPTPPGETPTASPTPGQPDGDFCANIDGIQTSVPDGLHLDGSGQNCVSFELGGPGTDGGGGEVQGTSTSPQVLGLSTTSSGRTSPLLFFLGLVAFTFGLKLITLETVNVKSRFL